MVSGFRNRANAHFPAEGKVERCLRASRESPLFTACLEVVPYPPAFVIGFNLLVLKHLVCVCPSLGNSSSRVEYLARYLLLYVPVGTYVC